MARRRVALLWVALAGWLCLGAGASPRAVTFQGRVFDPQGRPAGGATVWVSLYDPGWIGARVPEPRPRIRQTRTAADGSFHLSVSLPGDMGWATLVAQKAGYGPGGIGVAADAETTGLALALTGAGSVAGRVVDAGGRPVVGAKVSVQGGMRPGLEMVFPLPESVRPPAVTDAQGRFRIAPVPALSQLYLAVEHPGYARLTTTRSPVRSGTRDLKITLQKAASIAGRVLAADGQPAVGVTVRCQPNGAPPPDVTTDAAGHFQFSELSSGAYTVSVVPREERSEFGAEPQRVVVQEGAEARCPDLRLAPPGIAGVVTGKVTDAATGRPVAAVGLASVQVPDTPGVNAANGPVARSGADGGYRLRLPPGKWRLFPSYLPSGYYPGPPPSGPSDFTLTAGQQFTRDFTVSPGVRVRGRVLDAAGRPAAGARVKTAFYLPQPANLEGRFSLLLRPSPGPDPYFGTAPNDASQGPQLLTAVSRDGGQGAQVELTPAIEQRELVVRLQPLPRVTGRVTDEAGAPIAGARVRVDQVTVMSGGERSEVLMEALADPHGQFSLALLPGLTYRILAEAEGYSIADRYPIEVERGKQAAPLSLRLPRADRAIAGTVVDPDGKPLAGVQVSAWKSADEQSRRIPLLTPWTTTDAQGRFRFDHLPHGEFSVSASMSGYGFDRKAPVQAGTTNVRLMLAPREPPAPPSTVQVGARAPEIQVSRWLNGPGVPSLAALRGKTVLLQFSSPYNRAAKASNAALKALATRLKAAGRDDVAILALYDPTASAAEVEAYARSEELPFPIGLVAPSPNAELKSAPFQAYGVRHLPTLFLIDREGIIRAVDPPPSELMEVAAATEGPHHENP